MLPKEISEFCLKFGLRINLEECILFILYPTSTCNFGLLVKPCLQILFLGISTFKLTIVEFEEH